MHDLLEKIRRDANFALADAMENENREAVALETLVVHPLGDPDVAPRIMTARSLLEDIQSGVSFSMVAEDFEYRYLCAVEDACENGELSSFDARIIRCAAGLDGFDWGAGAEMASESIRDAQGALYG